MRKRLLFVTCLISFLVLSCKKTPEIIDVESVSLNTTSLSLTVGDSFELTATVLPEKAAEQYPVIWKSKASDIVSVSNSGVLMAKAPGETMVTAYSHTKEASCKVIVSEKIIPVTGIQLDKETLDLVEGESVTLSATVLPEDASDKTISWISSNSQIASVDNGIVTAVSEGSATITAKAGDKEATCQVSITKKVVPVSSVTLDQQSARIIVGESLQLTASVLPADATDKTVIWTSSDESVATVDGGLVTAVSAGEATITATAGEYSATCLVTVSVPFSYDGMCLESIGNGSIRISNQNQLTIDYKIEQEDWASVNSASIVIETKAGQRVWFRGLNETYSLINPNDEKNYIETTISCQGGDYYLYGNLMSLIFGDDFEGKTEMTGEHAFFRLFFDNTHLINHPTKDILLPATTLSPACYQNMFYGCAKLTKAPKLPAKVLTKACYASMFAYCSALKEFPEMAATDMAYMSCTWMMMRTGIEIAPELPAMNLAMFCYEFMFSECPDLKKGPSILPATKLASSCYLGMFQRCEKLETAPELPATELKYSCYSHMFNGCKSLKKAPKLPATSLAEACYQRMFGNSGLTEAPELPAMDLEVMCYHHMFDGSTSLEKAPILPATVLNYWCYDSMFHGCSSLNYIKMMATHAIIYHSGETLGDSSGYKVVKLTNDNIGDYMAEYGYTENWVDGVASTGTFVKNPEAVWDLVGVNGVPEGSTVQE